MEIPPFFSLIDSQYFLSNFVSENFLFAAKSNGFGIAFCTKQSKSFKISSTFNQHFKSKTPSGYLHSKINLEDALKNVIHFQEKRNINCGLWQLSEHEFNHEVIFICEISDPIKFISVTKKPIVNFEDSSAEQQDDFKKLKELLLKLEENDKFFKKLDAETNQFNNKTKFNLEKAINNHEEIKYELQKQIDFKLLNNHQLVINQKPFVFSRIITLIDKLLMPLAVKKNTSVLVEKSKQIPLVLKGDETRLLEIIIELAKLTLGRTDFLKIFFDIKQAKNQIDINLNTTINFTKTNQFNSFESIKFHKKFQATIKNLIGLMNGDYLFSDNEKSAQIEINIPFEKVKISSNKLEKKPTIDFAILVIEDDFHSRILIEKILSKLHVKVVVAKNGHEGIQFFKKVHFNLVIIDIEMPGINGYETLLELKKTSSQKAIFWAFTAHQFSDTIQKIIDSGFDKYVPKPIKPNEFISEIESLILQTEKVKPPKPQTENQSKSIGINLDLLKEISDNDNNFIQEMIEGFIVEVPIYLSELENSIELYDLKKIKFLVHKLKSPINLLGVLHIENDFNFVEEFSESENHTNSQLNIHLQNIISTSQTAIKLAKNLNTTT